MYNEKELKAALESQYSEQPKIKQTLTEELQDHLNNISMSQDRIEGLLDVVYDRIFGNRPETAKMVDSPATDGISLVSLNRQARDLSVKLNEMGDKLTYLLNSL